jgi:hypothetical protein
MKPARPDNPEIRASGASLPDVSMLAAQDDPLRARPAARLGVALVGLARELAATRREIAVLKRENAALRSSIDGGALCRHVDCEDRGSGRNIFKTLAPPTNSRPPGPRPCCARLMRPTTRDDEAVARR